MSRACLLHFLGALASCAPAASAQHDARPTPFQAPASERPSTSTVSPMPSESSEPPALSSPPRLICTQADCINLLKIELDQSPGQAGSYQIDIEADGRRGHCEITLPVPKCGEPAAHCDGTFPIMAIENGACEKPAKDQALFPIGIGAAPNELVVRVRRDKKLIAERRVKPKYTVVQPNGPKCEPTCHSGNVTISLAPARGK